MSNKNLEFSRGELIANKYEVVEPLDDSPLGVTYRAKHVKSGKFVRLTMLRPKIAGKDNKEQLLKQFNLAKEITHTNLVKVGELGEHEGIAYYTYEDFDGQTLRQLLQEYKVSGTQFGVKDAAQVVQQILEGAAQSHKKGMFLRGIRPEHVLINARRTGPRKQNFIAKCKLVGTGFWDLVPAAVLAEDEFARGEAQYMAPELKSFEPNASPRADVYSAGVILYEMLTGSAPVGTFVMPRTKRPDLPEHIDSVIELALAYSPEDRYPSAQDFIANLQRTFDSALNDEVERKPIISCAVWALLGALFFFVVVILVSLRGDPAKEALAKDSQIRKQVFDQLNSASDPLESKGVALAKKHQNMLYIPAGPFVKGRLHSERSAGMSEVLAEVTKTDAFLIDAFEFPNLKGAVPATKVNYKAALAQCKEAGKRLCTANEWERACKGKRSNIYGYRDGGDKFDANKCTDVETPGKAGSNDDCQSEYSVFDLSGNYQEWTSTPPNASKQNRRIVKGGARGKAEVGARCAFGVDESVGYSGKDLSFRCCMSVE